MESNPPNCDRIEGEPKNAQNENNAPNEKIDDINDNIWKIAKNSLQKLKQSKQFKLVYRLSVNKNNQFSALQTENDCESDESNADEIVRKVKPPPIFVARVENI